MSRFPIDDKKVRHHNRPGIPRELTFSCYRGFPLLIEDEYKYLLSETIDRATAGHGFQLVAFVFMPEHVHLIVFAQDPPCDVSSLLSAIKKPHSFRVKQRMIQHHDAWLGKLTIRARPGTTTFRFWQEGTGHDRDINSGFHLRNATDYAHNNPVRRKLVAAPGEWLWSSWHHYAGGPVPPGLPRVQQLPYTDLFV